MGTCELSWFSFVQISGQKMKAEFQKILHLFEELEEGGESIILTISSKGASRPSSLCLSLHHLRHHQLQHQLLQQPIQLLHVTAITVVHQQGATLAASASVSPSPHELLLPIPHLTNAFNQHLILWWGQQQREYL